MTTKPVTLEDIYSIAFDSLVNAGANEENAQAIAETVMNAERDGSCSHGLFRVPGYIASLKSGKVNGNADPKLNAVTAVSLHCDGDLGYAPLAHKRCLASLADAALKNGLAILSLTRTHHFAALWPETEELGNHGLAAISCVSYKPSVAPYGSNQALYGTNPISFAWPRIKSLPLVFDMATASMAMGDIQIAKRDGKLVPMGTGLNSSGEPTTKPSEILEGVLLPFGGYKGSHIAMMIELLSGPLIGETVSLTTSERDQKDGGPPRGGQFILAMNPAILSKSSWSEESEKLLARLESLDGVRLPAERRYKNRTNTGPRQVSVELLKTISSALN